MPGNMPRTRKWSRKKGIKNKGNLKHRGLGLKPEILSELERISLKEYRSINQVINLLLEEALAARSL